MTAWRPTAALVRAGFVAIVGLSAALAVGAPSAVVLVAPLAAYVALVLVGRPRIEPHPAAELGHRVLHEGQGTLARLRLEGSDDVEVVTRVLARSDRLAVRPHGGRLVALVAADGDQPDAALEVSPTSWGRVAVGPELTGLHTSWAGFRWGPVTHDGLALTVLPTGAPFDSRAEAPAPLGVVGAHRSRREGDGREFSGIRPFHVGDRLRRIDWRVSLRTGDLHVVTTRAEEDAGVLIVVDATVDVRGTGTAPSSLDLTVRAAAAMAEHHLRTGDRVGLRVLGGGGQVVGLAAGQPQLRRVLGALAHVRPGGGHRLADRLTVPVAAGTTVLVLSPLLHPTLIGLAARLTGQGVPTLAVDTLPSQRGLGAADDAARTRTTDLAWRLRLAERDLAVAALGGTGCPVTPWRGPGSLDLVTRQLARRSAMPRIAVR